MENNNNMENNNHIEDFTTQKVKMINAGFKQSQIRSEVWHYLLNKYCDSMRLDAIIDLSMELYAEILKRVYVNGDK